MEGEKEGSEMSAKCLGSGRDQLGERRNLSSDLIVFE